jgi:uncharacterized membrane protein
MEAVSVGSVVVNGAIAVLATAAALWLRPWRTVDVDGPPWPWLAAWALLPLLWSLDRLTAAPLVQAMSGATLLVLLAGWPLAILALWPVAAITWLLGQVTWAEGLHRLIWLGVAPATLALVIGAGLRRWLPHHLFIYILGRGFFGAFVAFVLSSAGAIALHAAPAGIAANDLFIAHLLGAFAEATLTGMLTSILVAFHPEWLATYTDRLYLPGYPGDAP